MTTWLCNNCQNLDHTLIYGRDDAMFDLYATGREANTALAFQPGDKVYVLSRSYQDRVMVQEFKFTEKVYCDDGLRPCWALCGERLNGEIVTRAAAFDHPVYRYFFNSVGHLNQWSAIRMDPK
jgi:hypothetical protein